MADPTTKREMEAEITAALAKMGVGGNVIMRGGAAELHGHGEEIIAIDLAEWLEQWALLPPEMRTRRAEAAAQRLRAAAAGSATPVRRKSFPLSKVLAAAALLALVAIAFGWLRMKGFFGSDSIALLPGPNASATASGPPPDPSARSQRNCGAARSRLRAGANMGIDIDGWVVELWLADVDSDAPLRENETVLKAVRGQSAKALAPPPPHRAMLVKAPRGDIGAEQVVLQFAEGFVTRFFSVEGRAAMVEHAREIARGTGAQYAALYARCEHLPYHDVGAWYAGHTERAAVVSMLYAAGTYSEPAALSYNILNERGDALDVLEHALMTGEVDAASKITALGGRIAPDKLSISFGLGGPTLATKASRQIAAAMSF